MYEEAENYLYFHSLHRQGSWGATDMFAEVTEPVLNVDPKEVHACVCINEYMTYLVGKAIFSFTFVCHVCMKVNWWLICCEVGLFICVHFWGEKTVL
jgi:hypothetical protein